MQPRFLLNTLKLCRANDIHTAIDTCGFASNEVFSLIFPYTNLFLFDLKLVSPKKHKYYTGQPNHIIFKNLLLVEQSNTPTIIRIPLIPGITDNQTNLEAIKSMVKPLRCVKRIDLLPYHHMAKDKYRRMNLPYELENIKPYADNQLDEIKLIFNDLDIPVTVGG